MDERLDAVLVGSTSDTIDARGRRVRQADYGRLVRETSTPPFGHSSIMFRRSAFDEVGGYNHAASRWEDVDLCARLARVGRVLVMAEPMVRVRVSEANTRIADAAEAVEAAMDKMYRSFEARGRPAEKLVPSSFVPAASIHVWRGRAPRILTRLLRNGDLSLDGRTFRILAWAIWADASPRTLRAFLRTRLAMRNRRALRRLAGASVVEWAPITAIT
jgi:GT2 family glycosyltransferase